MAAFAGTVNNGCFKIISSGSGSIDTFRLKSWHHHALLQVSPR
jgi:hypothetical protein